MGQVIRAAAMACALALAFAAPVASADEPQNKAGIDEARQRRDRGLKLYEEGAYEAALAEFQRAYELAPTYKLLYNVALAHRQLNDFAAALRALERFLAEGANDVPAKRRTDVEREIAELQSRVATVTVSVEQDGAEITLDDVPLGKSPLRAALTINPGKRRFSAKKDGFAPTTKTVTVAGSDAVTVSLELVRLAPPVASSAAPEPRLPPQPPPAPPLVEPKRSIPWVAWGATGALAVSAAVTGYLALASSRDLASQRDAAGQTRASLDAGHDKTKKLALVSDVLTCGALIAGGVALYFTVRRPSERPTVAAGVQQASVQPTLEAGLSGSSIVLRGRF